MFQTLSILNKIKDITAIVKECSVVINNNKLLLIIIVIFV